MAIDHERRYTNLIDRIETTAEVSDGDREPLLAFDDQMVLLGTEYDIKRRKKLLQHCSKIAKEVGNLAAAAEGREAAEDIVRWIHRTYDNEETNRDYRVALRMFGRHVTDGDEVPDSVSWVSATTSGDYNPMPDPSKMLFWDEHIRTHGGTSGVRTDRRCPPEARDTPAARGRVHVPARSRRCRQGLTWSPPRASLRRSRARIE